MGKLRNKDLVEDDRWKMRGGPMKQKVEEPVPCPRCWGFGRDKDGEDCTLCLGSGESYE